MSDPVIRVENLSKEYVIGARADPTLTFRETLMELAQAPWRRFRRLSGEVVAAERYWALDDISFEVPQGQITGIIGRNGAGKSTLLKILSRITEPTRGRAVLRGRVSSLLEVGTGFHPELTGRENIQLNGAILGMSRREIQSKFDDIVEFAEITTFLDTPVKRYSSGMYVRLAFSVAAHLSSEVLLVDEILAVGDARFQAKCIAHLESLSGHGRTVLFVSHNMGVVSALCERCLLLDAGRLQTYDTTERAIALYNGLRESDLVVSIEPRMRTGGNGAIAFTSCAITDGDGKAGAIFHVGDDIRLAFELNASATHSADFWVLVSSASGAPLLNYHKVDSDRIRVDPGAHRLVFTMRAPGLLPGRYVVSAGAVSEGHELLESVEGCQSFEILPAFADGRACQHRKGVLTLPGEWHWDD